MHQAAPDAVDQGVHERAEDPKLNEQGEHAIGTDILSGLL
ncbi:hypothetical protein SODG_006647 [Sodalis praecaptivus]